LCPIAEVFGVAFRVRLRLSCHRVSLLFAYTSLLVCAAPSFAQGCAVREKETPQFQSAVIPFSFEDNRIFI